MATEGPSAGVEDSYVIKVKTLQPATYEVDVNRNCTVAWLKAKLVDHVNWPVERQRLIYKGRVLQDEQTLGNLGIEAGHSIHLVERPQDVEAPPTGPTGADAQTGGTRRMPTAGINIAQGQAGLGDLGRFLSGMFSGIAGQPGGMPSGTPGAMPGGMSGAVPPGNAPGQQQRGTAAGPAEAPQPVPPPHPPTPHLLMTLHNYINNIEQRNYPTPAIPVSSNVPPPNQEVLDEQFTTLTNAIRTILRGTTLPDDLQNLLDAAIADPVGRVEQVAGQQAPPMPSPEPALPAMMLRQQYRHTALAMTALADLLRRAMACFSADIFARLNELQAYLAGVTHLDNSNRQQASSSLRRLSGVLHVAAALMTELARVSGATAVAVEGNCMALVANTAAVLNPDGSGPAFPRLLPRNDLVGDLRGMMGGIEMAIRHATHAGMPGGPFPMPNMPGMPNMAGMQMQMPAGGGGPGSAGAHSAPAAEAATGAGAGDAPAAAAAAGGGGPTLTGIPGLPPGVTIPLGSFPFTAMRGAPGTTNTVHVVTGTGGEPGLQHIMAVHQNITHMAPGHSSVTGVPATGMGIPTSQQHGPPGSAPPPGGGLAQGIPSPMGGAHGMPIPPSGVPPGAIPLSTSMNFEVGDMMELGPIFSQMSAMLSALGQGMPPGVDPAAAAAGPGAARGVPPAATGDGGAGGSVAQLMQVLTPVMQQVANSVVNHITQQQQQQAGGVRSSPSSASAGVPAAAATAAAAAPPTTAGGAGAGAAPAAGNLGQLVGAALQEGLTSLVSSISTNMPRIEDNLRVIEMQRGAPAGIWDILQQVAVAAMPQQQQQPAAATAAAPSAPAPAAAATSAPATSAPAPLVSHPIQPAVAPEPPQPAAAAPHTADDMAAATSAAPAAAAAAASGSGAAAAPRGLGLGLKPAAVARKRPVAEGSPAASGTPPRLRASGDSSATAAAATAGSAATTASQPPPMDLGAMMQMMTRAMSGSGGGGGGGGAAGPLAGLSSRSGGAGGGSNPLAALMGGAAGGGGLNMNALLQSATTIASDPSMQPLIQSALTSLTGGGGARGGPGGGGGGLGDLLGSLMGGLGGGAGGGLSRGISGAGSQGAAAPASMEEVLSEELGEAEAAIWRERIEGDVREMSSWPAADVSMLSAGYLAGTPAGEKKGLAALFEGGVADDLDSNEAAQ